MTESIHLRPWAGWEDLPGMQAVLAEGLRDAPGRTYEHPGDVAWWIGGSAGPTSPLAERIRIWQSAGRILGWVVVDEDDVGEYVHPSVLDTPAASVFFAQVDEWLASLEVSLTRYPREDDDLAVARLRAAGWVPDPSGGMCCYSRSLHDAGWPADPRVRPVVGPDDLTGRLRITHAAFAAAQPFGDYARDRRGFVESPAYPAGWDLVAWTDGDEPAACCIAWPDPVSLTGNFEPVATHPRHTRRRFGTAVMSEGLRRLASAGMRRAIVRTPLGNVGADAFYLSIGFAPVHVERAYVRT